MKELSRSVKGLTVLITGTASGMGRATAEIFGAEGANVVSTDFNGDGAEAVAKGIVERGGKAVGFKLDVSSKDEIQAAVDRTVKEFGGLDIVVNNAGIAAPYSIDDPGYDSYWDKAVAVLLTSHQQMIRAALPHLRKSSSPRIVNIASTEGLGATPRNSAYSAAKAGVIGLTRGLAVELGREGITVNCICPGPISTGMTQGIPDENKAIFAKRRTALGRYGAPEEVGHMTVSLCLPAASYLTGAIIPVDGGLVAKNG